MEITNQSLKFHSDALPDGALQVVKLRGVERLSAPFRFELELISTDPAIDADAALYKPAKLGILQRLGSDVSTFRWFQGTLAEIEQHEQVNRRTSYSAVLVPDLWRLGEGWRSRVFQDMTTEQLVSDVLKRGLKLQAGVDYEWKTTRTKPGDPKTRPVYPEREYVVQYLESDLNLVQRWLEQEGIFYLFENDGTREKVLFADSSAAYKPISMERSSYPYRPDGASRSTAGEDGKKADAEDVTAFHCRTTRQPAKVALDDYNWRDPQVSLAVEAAVHPKGTAVQRQYNDHYKTPAQGAALAEVRAAEWTCRREVYRGESTCRGFRPGRTFELEEHYREDWNRSYLLVSVTHEAEQSINLEASNVTSADYRNSFEAIPADLEFSPERTARWPQIQGVTHARIDGEGEGQTAELDELGRYKVRIPWDERAKEAAGGKASRWIRMAQPYAGPSSGMHFPLLKGTEVLLVHIDGDPDRPIIAAAVPDNDTVSPATHANPTQNVLRTPSGNVFITDDDPDRNGFLFMDASRSFVQDFRGPTGGSGGGGQGGGSGGEPRDPALQEKIRRMQTHGSRAEQAKLLREVGKELAASRGDPAPSGGRGTEPYVTQGHPPLGRAIDEFTNGAEPVGQSSMKDMLGTALDKLEMRMPNGVDPHVSTKLIGLNFHTLYRLSWSTGVGEIIVSNANIYSYIDNSLEVKVTSGNGESYTEGTGDSKSTEIIKGNSNSFVEVTGNQESTTMNIGDVTSSERTTGKVTTEEVLMGGSSSTTVRVWTTDEYSFDLSNSIISSLKVGTTEKLDIAIGAEASLNITGSARVHTDIVATADAHFALTGANKFKFEGQAQFMHMEVPDKVEVFLKEAKASLDATYLGVNEHKAAVKRSAAAVDVTLAYISQVEGRVAKQESALKKVENTVNHNANVLTASTAYLRSDETSLAKNVKTFASSVRAGIHTID